MQQYKRRSYCSVLRHNHRWSTACVNLNRTVRLVLVDLGIGQRSWSVGGSGPANYGGKDSES